MNVRYVKTYTVWTGNQFMAFEDERGRRADICIRVGRHGLQQHTRAEARVLAERRLAHVYPVGYNPILPEEL